MSEKEIIAGTTHGPITRDKLVEDLRALGVSDGMVLIVHSSLSALGWVSGGAPAVVLALEDALGERGTLVMPTHSGDLSDPADWSNPPVPEDWFPVIRETMPAFDRDLTATRGMGAVPECFRKQRGALRSGHPQGSFTARGPLAEVITADHPLDFAFGENSPLARVYEEAGWILLLGVGQESNTSLHLAEYRAEFPGKEEIQQGAPLLVEGERKWVTFREYPENSERFPEIGEAYQRSGGEVRTGQVGQAEAVLIPQRELVDFAVQWLEANPA
jgi:aminoglycoside 3-N-acetyltransferase